MSVLRLAQFGGQLALGGLRVANSAVKGLYASKGLPGVIGQKALEYNVIVPALGAGAMALGLPFGAPKPPGATAGVNPAGANQGGFMGMGMTPSQQQFMYGSQGFSWPWQSQEGFLDRQLRTQRDMFNESQRTIRLANQNNFALGNRSLDNQIKIADFSTSRQLEGLRDTNATRVALADRELAGLYDTNRSRIKMADIGSRTAMYQADRSVEVARWGGAPMRIATFGALMR